MKYHIKENTVQETRVIPLYGCKRCSGLYPNLFRDETETGLDFQNPYTGYDKAPGPRRRDQRHHKYPLSDQCYECGRRSPAADILNEENISYSFDVQVIVDELKYEGRSIRGIVPPALRGDAV